MKATDRVSILVVDDLPEKLQAYEVILEELGQELVMVRSGEEALRAVLAREFAVILLDVNMPGMDGFETAAMIRRRRKSAHTPIIFLTAFTDEMRMAQGYASGAVDYLPTPVIPEVLKAKVKVFIELSQMRARAALQAQEHAMRTAAEEAARRSEFLMHAGEALGGAEHWDDILRLIAALPVPELSDLAALRLVHPDTGRVQTVYRWHDGEAARSGESEAGGPFAGWMAALMRDAASFAGARAVPFDYDGEPQWQNLQTALALPVRIRGALQGVLMLARSHPAFGRHERGLADDFIARAEGASERLLLLERIRRADQRKDEFLAMLAHELRNPLAPIRNAMQILSLTQNAAMQAEAKATIESQLHHLIHLVDDLMDVSRITQGKIELRRETLPLQDALRDAIDAARPLIEQRRHRLRTLGEERPLWVHADRTRLAQIFSNLLNNAAKYTPDGGEIRLEVTEADGIAQVAVTDSGIGIPPDMLHQVFDLFAQVDSSLERAHGGLGIGLTLVKNLTAMHGGQVEAHSDGAMHGSRFTVKLPLTAAPADQQEDTSWRQAAPGADALRVLVVDDNLASAKTMGWMIELSGHEIRLAHSGAEAIVAAREFLPSVVMLDIGLPGMSGYEVCRTLRREACLRDTIFIAQTGWGQEEHRKRSREAGFHHHLVKPIDFDALQRLFEDIKPARHPSAA